MSAVHAVRVARVDRALWVVFWLDNGEGDFGKVDNVNVTATAVPEPSALGLVAVAGAACALRRRR